MNNRLLASLLYDNPDRYFMSHEISSFLSIKEHSVFRCVYLLRKAGMKIERKRGKGYKYNG